MIQNGLWQRQDIVNYLAVTALDISPQALSIYQAVNAGKAQTVEGSIFSLPFGAEAFDGVYNLGVMNQALSVGFQSITIR